MLILIFLLSSHHTVAQASILSLAQRTSQPSCWIKYKISSQRSGQTYACLTQQDWILWLNQKNPLNPLSSTQGHSSWRSFSPLILQSTPHPQKKKVITQQKIKFNPSPRSQHSVHTPSPLQRLGLKITQLTEQTREQISLTLKPHDSLGILRSLILHEGIQQEPLPMLRRLGFVHLITTTGIHLYSFREVLSWILKSLSPLIGLKLQHALILRRILTFTGCFTLWLLNGARLGMLRPWIIILLQDGASELGVKWKRGAPLLLVVTLELMIQSLQYIQTGTPYSTSTLFYTLAVGGGLLFIRAYTHSHLGLALGSWVLLALWEAWEEHLISFATPLLSLITLPFICSFIYPSILILLTLHGLGLTGIAQLGLQALDFIFHWGMKPLIALSLLPGNVWIIPHQAWIAGVILSLILSALLLSKATVWARNQIRLTVLICLLIFRFTGSFNNHLKNKHLKTQEATQIIQLDVGQGDSALVFQGSHAGLIDGGSRHSLRDEDWLKLLASRHVSQLQWVAVSHLDEDHVGGIYRLSRLIPIHCVATPTPPTHSPQLEHFQNQLHGISQSDWRSECIPFPTQVAQSKKVKPNSHMGVLFIPLHHEGSFLSTGDLNAEDELSIGQWAAELSSKRRGFKLLKVSHHGSKTATSPEFLQLYTPNEAWISAGHRNPYHHPHPSVLKRLSSHRIKIRRTDLEGPLSSLEAL